MDDAEILTTRRVAEVATRSMNKIVLTFTVLGKPVKIHIEFKNPVEIDEIPRTVMEAPEENLLEALEAQIYVYKKDEITVIQEVAGVEEEDEDEEEKD